MARRLDVIDADGHVLEPADLWLRYMEPAFRSRAPRVIVDTDGMERFAVEGKIIGGPKGIALAGALLTHGESLKTLKYADGVPGGFDPHARIKDLDRDGIDAVFLYPSIGLYCGAVEEPALAAAMCRAYNRWLADYCSAYPQRLYGVAMLPMQSVEHAVGELEFARKTLGFTAAFLRPNPYNNRLLGDTAYNPVWAAAQALDCPIGLHEGFGGMSAVGVDRAPASHGARHAVSHTMEMMLASMNVIWGGVCERFPSLRFAFLECGGGWMPAWLDRMDRHFKRKGVFDDSAMRLLPSEYFRRQCWISFEPVETTIAFCAELLGPRKLLWATDYPHNDGFFPGAPAMVAERLPEAMRRDVLAQGAIDYYGIAA